MSVIIFNTDSNYHSEIEWLAQILTEKFPEYDIIQSDNADIYSDNSEFAEFEGCIAYIAFFSFWDYENYRFDTCGIPVSRKWFVVKENSFAGRKNTTLELCNAGKEEIIALNELKPPDIALRVNGLAVSDEEYPLVYNAEINMHQPENKKNLKKGMEYFYELENFIKEANKPLINEKPVLTWICSAGDLMLGRNAGNILLKQGPHGLFGELSEILLDADITIVNLEGPLSSRGTKEQKTFTFRFEPPRELAVALKNSGIDAVLFANNHTFDFGDTAFLDTLNYLNEADIGILGAGRNLESILQPWRFNKDDFTALFWGIASFPKENSGYDGIKNIAGKDKHGFLMNHKGGAEALMERFEKDKLNVVLFHGGAEWSRIPNQLTRELYSRMARAGADLIIGSHPHIVQGFEWIDKEKLIFWSLGNFVFAGMEDTGGGDEGLLIRLGYLGKQPIYIEPFAVELDGPVSNLANDQKLETFYIRSKYLAEMTE